MSYSGGEGAGRVKAGPRTIDLTAEDRQKIGEKADRMVEYYRMSPEEREAKYPETAEMMRLLKFDEGSAMQRAVKIHGAFEDFAPERTKTGGARKEQKMVFTGSYRVAVYKKGKLVAQLRVPPAKASGGEFASAVEDGKKHVFAHFGRTLPQEAPDRNLRQSIRLPEAEAAHLEATRSFVQQKYGKGHDIRIMAIGETTVKVE